MTVLLIEQNARKAISVASRGYVLQKGVIVASGTREELQRQRNPEVRLPALLMRHRFLS